MTLSLAELESRIQELAARPGDEPLPPDAEAVVSQLIDGLERGDIRSARRDDQNVWHAIPWVKRGILLAFRVGRTVAWTDDSSILSFLDKHTLPVRRFGLEDGVRVVPGGSSVRRGAYVAPNVVCMPPMYINVGAWVGRGTMVDSHALVGSCAQVGERVHLSAAAQIGGVLEPVNAAPVIVEDDVIVGGNCGVYEGTVVRQRAVLAAGTILTRGTAVFDLVQERVYRGTADSPLEIPAGAVVVPGARQVATGWGAARHLSLQTPVIVKYRDDKTELSTALEGWLR